MSPQGFTYTHIVKEEREVPATCDASLLPPFADEINRAAIIAIKNYQRLRGFFAHNSNAQVACQTYPLGVPNCSPAYINNNNNGKPSLGRRGYLAPSISSSPGPPSTTAGRGSSAMPSVFLPSSGLVLPGYARRAAAAVLMCFLGLLLSLGESPMLWVVFAAAIAVVAALCDGGDGEGAGMGPVAHFGFPAEFQLVNEEEGEMAGIGERPQVRVCARRLLCMLRRKHVSSYLTERSIVLLWTWTVYIYTTV